MNNPYEVLGTPMNATDEQIKNAYREKARQYQSNMDSPLDEEAKAKMRELDEAYDAIINGRRTGGNYRNTQPNDSYNDNSYGYNASSYTPPTYAGIRETIMKGNLDAAQNMLNNIPDNERIAEWFYLQGMIQHNKGFDKAAFENYETAYKMNPGNQEYKMAYESMNTQRNGGYRVDSGNKSSNRGCSFCDMCTGLVCADSCCECFGGDVIPCC